MEEFGPKIIYIKGAENIGADAFSRLPIDHTLKEIAT